MTKVQTKGLDLGVCLSFFCLFEPKQTANLVIPEKKHIDGANRVNVNGLCVCAGAAAGRRVPGAADRRGTEQVVHQRLAPSAQGLLACTHSTTPAPLRLSRRLALFPL